MASAIATTLTEIVSAFERLHIFEDVSTNEPKAAPGKGATCAIFLADGAPIGSQSGLASASVVTVLTVRIYVDMLRSPVNSIDPDLASKVDAVLDALGSDFDLGGTVRSVDFFGYSGTGVKWEAGYVEVGGKMCRIADITVPLMINDTIALTR